MKLLVLISLVAFCSSQSTYVGKHVTVGSDGLITIVGEQGRQINIYRNAVYPRKIDIVLKSVYGPTRKIEVDEVNTIHNVDFNSLDSKFFSHGGLFKNLGSDYTQHDVLVHLFREYQGLIDSDQYEKMLETIHYLVQQGVLHESIWDVLRFFDSFYHAQKYQQYGAEKYIPRDEEYGVGHYGSEYYQKLSPLHRLYSAFQQRKYNQEFDEEHYPKYSSQQHYYGQFQKNPWAKYFNVVKGEKLNYPYKSQYQTSQEYPQGHDYQQGYYHKQVYPQGYYHQQEYPQGYYHQQAYPQGYNHQQVYSQGYYHQQVYPQGYYHQQEYPQGYYHQLEYPQGTYHQQKYNQQWWNPQQYTQYHKEVYPQEWNMAQEHHFYGKLPTVY